MPITRKLLMPALLSLAIAPLSLTALADGQRGGYPGHQDGGPRHEALLDRLDLDAETRAAVDEAREAHRQAYRELRGRDFEDREARHGAIRALHAEHRAELDELLDESQRQALAEARQEQREARRAAMQARLDAVIDGWGLSEEERQALVETREAIARDLAEFRDRDFENREARRTAMAELREAHQAALAELLDETQLEELKAALSPWRGDRQAKQRGHQDD